MKKTALIAVLVSILTLPGVASAADVTVVSTPQSDAHSTAIGNLSHNQPIGVGMAQGALSVQQTFDAAKPSKLQGALPGIPAAYGPTPLFVPNTNSVNVASVPFVLYYDRLFSAAYPAFMERRAGSRPFKAFGVLGESKKTTMYFIGSPSYFNSQAGAAPVSVAQLSAKESLVPLGYLVVSPVAGQETNVSLPVIVDDAMSYAETLRGYDKIVLIQSAQAMGAGLGQIASGSSIGGGIGGSSTSVAGFIGINAGGSKGDSATFMVSQLSVMYLVAAVVPDGQGVVVKPGDFERFIVTADKLASADATPVAPTAATAAASARKK